MKDIFETISKLRLIESTQFVFEELTPAEQQELDALAKELEPEMGRIPELDALLLQHKKLASGGQAAQPAAGGKMLRLGSSGPEVEKLQKDLGIQPADGKFGPATEKAVRTFQQTNKIQVDGIVGPETRTAIEKSQAAGQDPAAEPGQKPKPSDDATKPGAVNKGGKTLDEPVTTPQADNKPAQGQAAQPGGTVANATKATPTGAPVNPANPGGVSSKMTITPDQAQAVLDNGSERDIAAFGGKERLQQLAGVKPATPATPPAGTAAAVRSGQGTPATPATPPAAGQAAQPATPAAPGTTTTSTTKSQVSGNIRMGKPSGPITYNGKTVNPNDPEYGAASQALMNVYNKKNNRVNWANKVSGNSTAPVQGPTNAPIDRDF